MAAPESKPLPAAALAPESVLVVEDDPVIALVAEAALRHIGSRQVALAASQDEALKLLRRQRFDLALLDVNLGTHDSAGVARRLARLGTPAIVTTGYSDIEQLAPPLRRLPHLCKPYDQDDLARAIAQASA
jgi:CheY-like chemotaxis protein